MAGCDLLDDLKIDNEKHGFLSGKYAILGKAMIVVS